MRGSLRQRRPGVWELRIYAGTDAAGKKHQRTKTVHAATKTEAQRALTAWVADLQATGTSAASSTVTVAQAVEGFCRRRIDAGRWKPVTATNNRWLIDRWLSSWPMWSKPLEELRTRDVDDLYARVIASAAGDGRSSAVHVHRLLRAAINDAVRREEATRNACDRAEVPAVPKRRKVRLELGKLAEILSELETAGDLYMATLLRVVLVAGVRRGELCALKWSDLDLEAGTVSIHRGITYSAGELHEHSTKTGEERDLAIDPTTVDLLRRHQEQCRESWGIVGVEWSPEWRVWPGGATPTTILRPDSVTHRWDRIRRQHGIDCTFHELRHQNGTWMIALGVDPTAAAGRQGHSVEVHLRTYTHASTDADRPVADMLGRDLDEHVRATPQADVALPDNVVPLRRRATG